MISYHILRLMFWLFEEIRWFSTSSDLNEVESFLFLAKPKPTSLNSFNCNDIFQRINEVNDLIRSRDILKAAQRLYDMVEEFCRENREWRKDCAIMCGEAEEINYGHKRGDISYDEYLRLKRRISGRMFDIKEDVILHFKTLDLAA